MQQITLKGRIYANKFVDEDGNEFFLYSKWKPVEDEVFARCMFKDDKMLILKYIRLS